MKLKKLLLENFKGYKGRYELEIKKDINVFIGQNDVEWKSFKENS